MIEHLSSQHNGSNRVGFNSNEFPVQCATIMPSSFCSSSKDPKEENGQIFRVIMAAPKLTYSRIPVSRSTGAGKFTTWNGFEALDGRGKQDSR